MKTLRAFIAFELPPNIIFFLENLQTKLKKDGISIRWVRPSNIHLTLRFLGDIPVEKCSEIATALDAAAKTVEPIKLCVKGLGVFPTIKNPRVFWAGLAGETPSLGNFQQRLENCLFQQGIKKEKRPFKAHLTIGRIKHRIDSASLLSTIRAFCEFEPQNFNTDQLTLFQSELKPTGAVYTRLFTKVLK